MELSYLTNEEQEALLNEIEYADATPSLSQAQRLRGFSRQGRLTADVIFAVMSEEKANPKGADPLSKRGDTEVFPQKLYGQGYAEYHSEASGKVAAAERTKRKGGTVNGR